MIEVPEWADPARRRVEVDNGQAQLRVRLTSQEPWVLVRVQRPIRQYLGIDELVLVCWGAEADGEDEPGLRREGAAMSAFDYLGSLRWTITGGDLPYFGREETRAGGWCSVSRVLDSDRTWLRIGSGGWYCELLDLSVPRLGPAVRA